MPIRESDWISSVFSHILSWPRLAHSDHSLPKAFEFCRLRVKDVPKTFGLLYPESVPFIFTFIIRFSSFQLLPVRWSQKTRAMTQFGLLHSSFSSRYYHYSIFNIKTESHSWVNFSFFATDVRMLIRYFFRTIFCISVCFSVRFHDQRIGSNISWRSAFSIPGQNDVADSKNIVIRMFSTHCWYFTDILNALRIFMYWCCFCFFTALWISR